MFTSASAVVQHLRVSTNINEVGGHLEFGGMLKLLHFVMSYVEQGYSIAIFHVIYTIFVVGGHLEL